MAPPSTLDRTFNTLLCPLVSTRTGTGTQPPDAFDFFFSKPGIRYPDTGGGVGSWLRRSAETNL